MPNNTTTKKYLFQYTNPQGNVAVKQGDIEEMKRLQSAGTLLKAGPVTEANIKEWSTLATPTSKPKPTTKPTPTTKPLNITEQRLQEMGLLERYREQQAKQTTTPVIPKPKPDLPAIEKGIAGVREKVEALKPKVAEEVARREEPELLPFKGSSPLIEDLGLDKEEDIIRTADDTAKKRKQMEDLENIAEQMTKDKTEIEKLTTQQQLRNLREDLGLDPETGEKLERPAMPTYASDFEALRDEHGVVAIETQLTTLNKEIANIEASLRLGLYAEEGELKPMELIGTAQEKLQRQGREQLDALNRRKAVLVDEYNTKANLINNLMTFKQMDYATAMADYDAKFNLQIQLLNILEKRETREQQEANMEKDSAKANWQILTKMIEDQIKTGDLTYDELSDDLKLEIKKLEMKGGLPTGFTEQVLASVNPEKNIKTTIVSTDKTKVSIVYDDGTVETFSTGLTAEKEEYKAPTTKKFGDRWYQWDTMKGEWVDMGVEEGEAEFTPQEERKLEQAGLSGASRQEQLNYLYGDEEKPLELGKDTLRKLVIAGVPPDIAQGIFKDLSAGYSLEEIRQNLASQFGREKGFGYLDKTMPILEKAQEGIKVISM